MNERGTKIKMRFHECQFAAKTKVRNGHYEERRSYTMERYDDKMRRATRRGARSTCQDFLLGDT